MPVLTPPTAPTHELAGCEVHHARKPAHRLAETSVWRLELLPAPSRCRTG